ncbi:MAG TPA: lysophospholipid acyltransferase family protein [Mycobacteriales bacterium]|nr:lysophospholipid acyltransferase family protein [Mycobacteriales bacterium]
MSDRLYGSVIRVALGLFGALDLRFTVDGVDNIPDEGGAVLAANHVSFLDFIFVGVPAHDKGRLVRFLAKQSVFDNPLSGPLMRAMHHIPVDRSAGSAAYAAAIDALGAGELVGVFPEATISRSFVPRELKTGAARMSLDAGVPLLPVVVWGGQRLWTAGRWPRPTRHVPIAVHVGAPLDRTSAESAADLTGRLRDRLAASTEAVQRAYPAPASDRERWWQPAYLGGAAPTPEVAAHLEARALPHARRSRSSS